MVKGKSAFKTVKGSMLSKRLRGMTSEKQFIFKLVKGNESLTNHSN